jgi:hypothetical protein
MADPETARAPHEAALLDFAKTSAEVGINVSVDMFGADPFAGPRLAILFDGTALIAVMALADGRLVACGDAARGWRLTDAPERGGKMRMLLAAASETP